MEKIAAVWEKRNLGVTCEELIIAKEDITEVVIEASLHLSAEYQIIKIPIGRVDLLFALQKLGFNFIEANSHLSKKIAGSVLPKPFDSLQKNINYRPAIGDEKKKLLDNIYNGNIFKTDKVALDPNFSLQHSSRRYYFWSQDILDSNGQAYIVTAKEIDIGFFILRRHSNVMFESFLAGIYPEFDQYNLGFAVLSSPIMECAEQGGHMIEAGTSSNNISSLRLHLALGYEIQSIVYILVRHVRTK